MTEVERYDALFLGGGAAAKNLAPYLAKTGKKTAIVERRWIGGACPNVNCMPSKDEIWSAKVGTLARNGAHFGAMTGSVSTDMSRVRARKQDMVDRMIQFYLKRFGDAGAELVLGQGRLEDDRSVTVELNDGGTRRFQGDMLFIDVGTRALIPDLPGLAEASPLTSIEALELDIVPDHLVVIGGGYVGLEMAQAFRRFGSAVTVIQQGDRIAEREDADVIEVLQKSLTAEGIDILTSTELKKVDGQSGSSVKLLVETPAGSREISATHILVAAGRRPNTDGIGLEEAGIKLDEHGFIAVNERLETSAPNVWALAECAGSPQFTHVGVDDFRVIRDNLAGQSRSTRNRLVPYCMFTDPAVGRLGLGEDEARGKGVEVRVAKLGLDAVGRANTTDETNGFMKAIVAADSDDILGFVMVGADAGEVISVVQMAMIAGQPYTVLRDAILTHPTMAEGLGPLMTLVPARAGT